MKKRKFSFVWLLLLVPIAAAAILLYSAANGLFGLEIDTKVRPSDFVTVLMTTLLAYLLQNLWTRNVKRTDAEKELIQGHIRDAGAAVRAVRQCIVDALDQQPIPQGSSQRLIAAFEDCTDEMATLEVVIDNSHCSELIANCWTISGLVIGYKESITGGNFPNRLLERQDVENAGSTQREIARLLQMLSLDVSAT